MVSELLSVLGSTVLCTSFYVMGFLARAKKMDCFTHTCNIYSSVECGALWRAKKNCIGRDERAIFFGIWQEHASFFQQLFLDK